jgi:hypothetical protein
MITLKIDSVAELDVDVEIEVDPYLPIVARTSTAPLGAVFFRVGNFETSLVEIDIEPSTRIIRGISAVSLDCVGKVFALNNLPRKKGLPVVAEDALPANRVDELRKVRASMLEGVLVLDWSDGETPQYVTEHTGLGFVVGAGVLIGAVFSELSAEQRSLLEEQLSLL